MKDLLFFVCFILIFLCGFSITTWSLINTKSQIHWIYNAEGKLLNISKVSPPNRSWTLLKDIFNHGIWKVFGQVEPIGEIFSSLENIRLSFRFRRPRFVFEHGFSPHGRVRRHRQRSSAQRSRRSVQVDRPIFFFSRVSRKTCFSV